MITGITKGVFGLVFVAWAIWMVVRMVRDEEDKDQRTAWAVFFLLAVWLAVPVYFFFRYLSEKRRREESGRS